MSASDRNTLRDALFTAHDMARDVEPSSLGMVGYGVIEHRSESGLLIAAVPFANTITDTGDLYYAGKGIAAIPPASPAAPTALTGMQIGSGGATAVNKAATTGVALVSAILAGQAFDATFPSTSNLGVNLGVNMVYKTTYAAGTGTGTVSEATITNGTIGTASVAGNTISRVTFTGIVKGAADSLAITWNHKNLGT